MMPDTNDPKIRAAAQVQKATASIGRTVAQLADEVTGHGIDRHGAIVSHLTSAWGLTHGNANAVAHAIREHAAGGAPGDDDLLAHQFRGARAELRPILDAVLDAIVFLDDVEVVVQKTGVSLRRAKQFALVQVASATRVTLGLSLARVPDVPTATRLVRTSGMCSHRIDLAEPDDVDDEVVALLVLAHRHAG